MSSCISSRACGFDLEHMINWPCSRTNSKSNSNSSSPISSILSESSNSPVRISSQKQQRRTRRKRPNQTYNEAAALLSMASPNIFRIKHLTQRTNQPKFTKHQVGFFESPELISPFPVKHRGVNMNMNNMNRPCCLTELQMVNSCLNRGEVELNCDSFDSLDDFDTESILNEEMEQGIDEIMGNSNSNANSNSDDMGCDLVTACYGYPVGLGFGLRDALRNGGDRNWCSPMVDVANSSPAKTPVGKVKKKKKKRVEEVGWSKSELRLKLDYDGVLNDWADKGMPLPEEISNSFPGGDVHARAASIDLFSKEGGWNESGVTHPTDDNHVKKIRRPKYKSLFCSIST